MRILRVATEELKRNTCALRMPSPINRDVVDPTSASMKKCFSPIQDSLFDNCRPGVDPEIRVKVFGDKPSPQEIKTYRIWKARYDKIKDYVRSVEYYCRAGQERFPSAAAKYEFIRLQVIKKFESPPDWATAPYREQLNGIMDALREISILTIGDVIGAEVEKGMGRGMADSKSSKPLRGKCTSRFAGRTIRNLSVSAGGNTFIVCRDYTYKITAKQAIEFLDKLIESYEKTNKPVKAEFQVAAVFKRGDAARFKKRFMVCKNGFVSLNIPR